jgi:serine/threonine protein kinase
VAFQSAPFHDPEAMTGPGDTILAGVGDLPDPIEDEVLAALECEPAERDARLLQVLAAHPDHAAAIRRWLEASGVPLEGSGGGASSPRGDAGVPDHIGPYRMEQRLGRGHFGTVWLALQEQPIRRHVAIKVLNPGMDTREVLSRFAAEREALNRMDHPGIARLLDAGETGNGRPFFVMEYVRGEPLARHCRHHNLPVRARIELFLQVLDAVQHAHQRAVIHRDLSSNNVLATEVDGEWHPKVIDFGIAKSLAAPLIEGGVATFQNTLMGTPEFMSPEQARGRIEDVDTRTDIYALGVQLYELLTDTLPIPAVVLRSEGLAGMAHVIARFQPKLPSMAAPANRADSLGDLDWITMKALSKDPDGRYATVGDFAADLRSWLRDRPTKARPPSRGERVRRFVRKNVVAVAAISVMLVGLLAALAISLWSLRAARAAQEQAELAREQVRLRADAGYRLLANQERLQEALAKEDDLWPAWPEQVPALREWLHDLAEPLLEDLPRVRAKLEELGTHQNGGQFDDPAEEHLYNALRRLEQDVASFTAPLGPVASVRARLQRAETVEQRSLVAHAAEWHEACIAIKASDGVRASPYRGLQIKPQMDLVPLGMDPETRLWEFLQMSSQTHDDLPVRDATGHLQIGPDTGIVFVLLPPGEFWMGALRNEPGMEQNDPQARDDELSMRVVPLDAFLMARTELTREQWATLSEGHESRRGQLLPASSVDWLRATEVLRHWGLVLPTEAQWEYACRAGGRTPWSWGNDPAQTPRYAWFGPALQPVARLLPNAFGLYDMHGNAAEWTRDWWLADYNSAPARRGDGFRDTASGEQRVVRGGACTWSRIDARCSARVALRPDARDRMVGIRPARELQR